MTQPRVYVRVCVRERDSEDVCFCLTTFGTILYCFIRNYFQMKKWNKKSENSLLSIIVNSVSFENVMTQLLFEKNSQRITSLQ